MKGLEKWLAAALCAFLLVGLCPAAVQAAYVDDGDAADAQTVSEGDIVVGDGVTASFDEETGEVVFCSDGGTLWKDWCSRSGIDPQEVRNIRVAEGSKVYMPEDSSSLFFGFSAENLDLTGFDTSNVKDMGGMFKGCLNLKTLDLSAFDTSNVTDMSGMFVMCPELRELNLSSFNTAAVTDMSHMFYWCNSLSVDLRGFDTSNVTKMDWMFAESMYHPVNELQEYDWDLSSFDMTNVESAEEMIPVYWVKVKIPMHVSCNVGIKTMYDSEGREYKTLPNVDESITLMRFDDVTDPLAWYHKAVYWAFEKGVTSGYGPYTFKPTAGLTRAQTVQFIYKLAGQPDVSGYPDIAFADVADDAWYYDAVRWAVANGITEGYGEGIFQPNVICSRAMIVTFLMRYAKLAGTYAAPAAHASFKDVAANAWYREAVDWAVASGVTTGYGTGTFQPMRACNRAMMVTFLERTAELPKVSVE